MRHDFLALLIALLLSLPAWAQVDTDGDGVLDEDDNCTEVPNTSQCDDGHTAGIGNSCDFDANGDGTVSSADVTQFGSSFGSPGPFDGNCDGTVSNADVPTLVDRFSKAPGPAGASTFDGTVDFEIIKQTNCYSPCGVMVDAITNRANPKTNHNAIVNEFHDLAFQWDFIAAVGDDTADLNDGAYTYGEGGTNGKTSQFGPMAAHVYEITDGGGNHSFTIRLTVTNPRTGGQATITKPVLVLDPEPLTTECYTQDGDTDAICDTSHTSQAASAIKAAVEACGGKRCLFEGNQTWTTSTTISLPGNAIIGAYNIGVAKPTLDNTSSTGDDTVRSNGDEWTWHDFIFDGPASGEFPRMFVETGATGDESTVSRNVLVFRNESVPNTFHQAISAARQNGALPYGSWFIAENIFPTGFGAAFWGQENNGGNIIGASLRDSAIIGNKIGTPDNGEHVVRVFQCQESCLIADNELGPEKDDKRTTLTVRGEDGGVPKTTLVQISRNRLFCRFSQCANAVADNEGGNQLKPVGEDVLWDSNYCQYDEVADARTCFGSSSETTRSTLRNNACHRDITAAGGGGSCIAAKGQDNWCHNNSMYQNGSSQWNPAVVEGDCIAANNLLYAPDDDSGALVLKGANGLGGNLRVTSNPWIVADPDTIDELSDFTVQSPNAEIIDRGYSDYDAAPQLPRIDPDGGLLSSPLNIGVPLEQ